jgi:predicted TIM-barrel fold metal-dependent hydrolase
MNWRAESIGNPPCRARRHNCLKSWQKSIGLRLWAASIKALAAHENVYVKVGGLGQAINGLGFEKQAEPPSSEMVANAMRPYVETCIEAFGTRRSMFESNFPPDKEGFSYPVYWNACKRLTKGASATERADLFAGTATRFYRLNGIG